MPDFTKLKRELTYLQVKVALECADAGSFNIAARNLGMQQPKVTKNIRDLEKLVGFDLFIRTNRGSHTTAAGQQFLDRLRESNESLERALRYAINSAEGDAGYVSIACYPVHVERFLGHALGKFRASHPHVVVDLTNMRNDRRRNLGRSLLDEVADGVVEIAIGPSHNDERLSRLPLYVASIVAVVPNSHEMRRAKYIPISELKELPALIAPPEFFSRQRVSELAMESGFELRVAAESSSPSALLVLGREGFGVPILPDDYPLVGQHIEPYPIVCAGDGTPVQTEVSAYWRTEESTPHAVQSLIEVLRLETEREREFGRRRENYYNADLSPN